MIKSIYLKENNLLKLIIFCLTIFLLFTSNLSSFSQGNGSQADPWRIRSTSDLDKIRNYPNDYFLQLEDITISEDKSPWFSIQNFGGVYDGNNFKIKNLNVNRPNESDVGLFGRLLSSAVIKNVHIENSIIKGDTNVGALVGFNNGAIIENCSIDTSSVTGNIYVGGLIGYNQGIIRKTCVSYNVTVFSNQYAGGLVGKQDNGKLYLSSSFGRINKGDTFIGGLAGYNTNNSIIENCFTRVDINIDTAFEVGGLAGFNDVNCTINFTYSAGSITMNNYNDSVGGLVGSNSGVVTASFWNTSTYDPVAISAGGTGLINSGMKTLLNFTDAGWAIPSSDTWGHNESENNYYPYLMWQSYSGPVWYVVSDTGSDDLNGSSFEFPFKTITKALEMVSPGDTIMIGAGVYSETLAISADSISLLGSDSSTAILDIGDSVNVHNVAVYSENRRNIKIKDLQIRNYFTGIEFNNTKNSVIENIIIKNPGETGRGVHLHNNSNQNTIRRVLAINENDIVQQIGFLIESSSINGIVSNTSDNFFQGFHLKNNTTVNFINYNTSKNNLNNGFFLESTSGQFMFGNYSNDNGQDGFFLDFSDLNGLFSNIVNNNADHGFWLDSSNENNILNNVTNNNTTGYRFRNSNNNSLSGNESFENIIGFYFESASANNLSENSALNSDSYGFRLLTSNSNTFNNNISQNNSFGFYIESSSNNYFAQNLIELNNHYALFIKGTTASCTFSKNNFSGSLTNPDSVVFNTTSETLDFKNNWWQTSIVSGITSKIINTGSGGVLFQPYRLGMVDTGVGVDTIAPAVPVINSLISGAGEEANMIISWDTVTANENGTSLTDLAGYRIYRSDTNYPNYDWVKVGEVSSEYTKYTDIIGLTPFHTYYYRVTAFDNLTPHENESFYSDIVFDSPVPSPVLKITSPIDDYDTLNQNIIISGTTYNSSINDTVIIFVNRSEGDSYFLNLAADSGSWSDTITLTGLRDIITVRLIDRYNRISEDTIVVSYCAVPQITIEFPVHNYDTFIKQIYVSGSTFGIKGGDNKDTVAVFVNSVKVLDGPFNINSAGNWYIGNVPFAGRGDTMYIVLTDRFGREIISDSIIVNYYAPSTISIEYPPHNYDTYSNFIPVRGISSITTVGDTINIYVNSILKNSLVVTENNTDWDFDDVELIKYGRFIGDTIYVETVDRFGRKVLSDYINVNYFIEPEVKIIFPEDGYNTSVHTITVKGTSQYTYSLDTFTFYKNNVEKYSQVLDGDNKNWSFDVELSDFGIPQPSDSDLLTIKLTDRFGREVIDYINIVFYNTPPVVVINDYIEEINMFVGEKIYLTGENSYDPNGTSSIDTFIWEIFNSEESIESETIAYIASAAGTDIIKLTIYDNYNYQGIGYLNINIDTPATSIKTSVVGTRPNLNYFTVAFETDGNADYNDFVADLNIERILNSDSQIVKIIITSKALARGTNQSYEFKTGLKINGSANIIINEFYPDGTLARDEINIQLTNNIDFALFKNTKQAFKPEFITGPNHNNFEVEGNYAVAEIILTDPVSNPVNTADTIPYNSFLRNISTGEIIGAFDYDENGYPKMLVLPTNWSWPKSQHPISYSAASLYYAPHKAPTTVAYPQFEEWRLSGYNSKINWYDYPNENNIVKNTRPYRELNNQSKIFSNREAYGNDIVTLKIELENYELKTINKSKIRLYLPEVTPYKEYGSYPEPYFYAYDIETIIPYFDIETIYSDTGYNLYVEVEILQITDNLLNFYSELYVDNYLINTSDLVDLRIIEQMPFSPIDLKFYDFKNQTGRLEWIKPAMTNTKQYNIYWDAGTGIIDYETVFDTVPGNKTFYILENLTASSYKVVVRTVNQHGIEDINKNELIIRPVDDFRPVELPKMKIVSPLPNIKISGDNFKMIADIDETELKIFETTAGRRDYIQNKSKDNHTIKGNPNDYAVFTDAGIFTNVKVYTSEIHPFLILDNNFISITKYNSSVPDIYQFNYSSITDSGYLWTAAVPKIADYDTVYINLKGQRVKDYKNLDIDVYFDIIKSNDTESRTASAYPWTAELDISNYPQGKYFIQLRVSKNNSDTYVVVDKIPFEIDHLNWDRKDNKTIDNRIHTISKVYYNDTSVIKTNAINPANNKKAVISVIVPPELITSDSYTNNLKLHITERKQNDNLFNTEGDLLSEALRKLKRLSASPVFEIKLIDGLKEYNIFDKDIKIEMNFYNENNDGYIDDINIRENDIKLITYSSATNNEWREMDIDINSIKKTVSGFTSHFSFFMLASPAPAADANYVVVYPNPFVPNDGKDDNGIDYTAGVQHSGIIFDNLPSYSTLKIFTIRGSLVLSKTLNNTHTRRFQWDVRNENGYEVASGVYLYVITSPTGTKTGKFVIIR